MSELSMSSQPEQPFEAWFAATIGQSRHQVEDLLRDQTAIRFFIAWSLLESRCFAGYFRHPDLTAFARRLQLEAFDTRAIQSTLLHFYQRYQDKRNRQRLHHSRPDNRFDQLVKRDPSSLTTEEWIYFIGYIIFRFRNNIFHGNKGVASWLQYSEQIRRCTHVMQSLISHAESREAHMSSWRDAA